MKSLRRFGIAAAVVATLVAVPAIASALIVIDVPYEATHTGCLKEDGTIDRVTTGHNPKQACEDGEKEIHLSGGDLTSIKPGKGLKGLAETGDGSLSIDPKYQLPQMCTGGQVPKPGQGGSWKCGYDGGAVAKTIGPLTIDVAGSTDPCRDYSGAFSGGGEQTKSTGQFLLPAGKYRPVPTGNTRWFVSRTADKGDGETFTGGYVKAEIVQVAVFGAENVVSTWARAVDEHNDGEALPYNQDFRTFSSDGNGTYYLKVTGMAGACSRSQLLDASFELERVT